MAKDEEEGQAPDAGESEEKTPGEQQAETTGQDPEGSYRVGYRRPPKEYQFKPGQSGNKKGRRKGAKNLDTQFREAMNEKVTIKGSGKRITRAEAMVVMLTNKAAVGDQRAAALVMARLDRKTAEPELAEEISAAADLQIIQSYFEQMKLFQKD